MHVDAREDKGGESEGRETEGRRVGELAVFIGLPHAWVEGAALGECPGRVHLRVVAVVMRANLIAVTVKRLVRVVVDVVDMVGHCECFGRIQ